MNIQDHFDIVKAAIETEQDADRINSLAALHERQKHREIIQHHLSQIEEALKSLRHSFDALPALPDAGIIAWAQAVLALDNLCFMEIDTTGLDEADEIVRVTLLDRDGELVDDIIVKPRLRSLSPGAAAHNDLSESMLDEHGMDIEDAWLLIVNVLSGRFVVGFGFQWDVEQLNKMARRYDLQQIHVIGEDLRRRADAYYGFSLPRLADLAERAGTPLTSKNSIARCRAQLSVVQAMANAITDARPASIATAASQAEDDDLGDIDEHPF